MGGFAWVTLATNDSYSLGALVLAHSLKQAGTTQQLAVLITPGVTEAMREKLRTVFNVVQEVNILDSRDETNLRLLKRPELGITFTKLHCWRLTQYEKCVFLDADTLVLQNCDELFEREELSAAPDVGWPDCFNSGVFVYRPSNDTFEKLIQFALEKGSFDGGDQGLLNLYFSDWAHKDISKHLPFIYNMCSTACYSYLPAYKQFGGNAKIIHFIGSTKPWLQYFNTETRKVQPSGDSGHLQEVLQRWWDIFCSLIHPQLSPEMPEGRSQQNVNYPHPSQSQSYSHFPYQSTTQQSSSANDFQIEYDPWDEYDKKQSENLQNSTQIVHSSQEVPSFHVSYDQPNESPNTNASFEADHQPPSSQPQAHDSSSTHHTNHHSNESYYSYQQTDFHHTTHHDYQQQHYQPETQPQQHDEPQSQSYQQHNEPQTQKDPDINRTTYYNFELIQSHTEEEHVNNYSQVDSEHISQEQNISHNVEHTETHFHDPPHSHHETNSSNNENSQYHHNETLIRSPSPNSSLFPQTPIECNATDIVSNEVSLAYSTDDCDKTNGSAGLAGAFARLTLGVARTPEQDAFESVLRKQAWEVGNIDYLGKDSFDNIWSKISETLALVPTQVEPAKEVEVPKEVSLKAGTPVPTSETPKVEVPSAPAVTDTITSPPVQTSQPLEPELPPKVEASVVTAVSATELPPPAAELKSEPHTPLAVAAEETKSPAEPVVEAETVPSSGVCCPLPSKAAEPSEVSESPKPLSETPKVEDKPQEIVSKDESIVVEKQPEVSPPAQSITEEIKPTEKQTEVIRETAPVVPIESEPSDKAAVPVVCEKPAVSDIAPAAPVECKRPEPAPLPVQEVPQSKITESVPAPEIPQSETTQPTSPPTPSTPTTAPLAPLEHAVPETPVECKKPEPVSGQEPAQEVPQSKILESTPAQDVPQSKITEPTPPVTPSTPPTAPSPQLEKIETALSVESDVPATPPPTSSQDASPTPPPRKEGKPKKSAATKPKK